MILITGCAGFIGSALCKSLLSDKEMVAGIDNFDPYYDIRIKKRNLAEIRENPNFIFNNMDIRDNGLYKNYFPNTNLTLLFI